MGDVTLAVYEEKGDVMLEVTPPPNGDIMLVVVLLKVPGSCSRSSAYDDKRSC